MLSINIMCANVSLLKDLNRMHGSHKIKSPNQAPCKSLMYKNGYWDTGWVCFTF